MQIDLRTLKAANIAASKEETRYYYLGGVFVQVQGDDMLCVATDGHRLIAARDPGRASAETNWPVNGIIVPSALIDRIKLPRKPPRPVGEITFADGEVTIATSDEKHTMRAIEGTFPDWRRVLPRQVSMQTAQFNSDLLASFAKAKAFYFDTKYSPLIKVSHNGDAPALIDMGDNEKLFGVLLPYRASGFLLEPPAWATAVPPVAQEAEQP